MAIEKSPSCTVKTRIDYRRAPLNVLEDPRLSSDAKVLLTWVLMHGNGWEFRIGYACKQVGLTEKRWLGKARKELLEAGYFVQTRARKVIEKGKEVMAWENVITDDPLLSPKNVGIQEVGIQEVGIRKGVITNTRDITTPRVNKSLNKTTSSSAGQKQKPAEQKNEEENFSQIVEALFWKRQCFGGEVKYPARWKAKAAAELQRVGVTGDDLAALAAWQKSKAERAAVAAVMPLPTPKSEGLAGVPAVAHAAACLKVLKGRA